jgi:two-component system, NtrC family, sensor kinase
MKAQSSHLGNTTWSGHRKGLLRKPILVIGFLCLTFLLPCPNLKALPTREAIARAAFFMPINRDSAFFYADAAAKLAELELNDTLLGDALMLRGEALFKQNRFREAIRDFGRLQRIAYQRAEHLPEAQAWMWLGEVYLSIDSLEDATTAFDEAFVQWQAVGDQVQKAVALLRKGKALERQKMLPEAKLAYVEGLKIARRAFSAHETAVAHQSIGLLSIETQAYDLARQHLRSALLHFAKGPDDQERARCLLGLATVGVSEKKFHIAQEDAEKGIYLAQETGSRSLTMEFYQVLGDIMAGQGNFEKATDYYRLNALVRDSLTGAVGARELSEVVLEYEKEKAELGKEKAIQENALQNAQLQLRDASIKRQQTWFYIILAGMTLAMLFGGILAYAFMQKNRANRRLEQALSDLNTAQDQLVRSEKLASLGQVTAGIAHEIRNPLNFVNNLSQLSVGMIDELADEIEAIEGKPLDHAQAMLLKEYFEDIRSNAQKVMEHGQRASRIVRDMLQHSALEEGEKTDFEINELVEEYMKVAFHSQPALQKGGGNANCDLVLELDPLAGKIKGLRPEIGRAFLNIMVNAFEAVELKRESGAADYVPQVKLRTEHVAGGVRVLLQDNGPGISALDRKKVFDPFFTTKPPAKGTGLGLSLAHETIVRKHKGKIEVESTAEQGTLFRIFLPSA